MYTKHAAAVNVIVHVIHSLDYWYNFWNATSFRLATPPTYQVDPFPKGNLECTSHTAAHTAVHTQYSAAVHYSPVHQHYCCSLAVQQYEGNVVP